MVFRSWHRYCFNLFVRFAQSFLTAVLVACSAFSSFASDLSDQVLAEMNLARTNPRHYANVVAQNSNGGRDAAEAVRFLNKVRPLPPLSASTGLAQSSMRHVADQGPRGGRGHGSMLNTPFSRMEKYGQWLGTAGENIYYGRRSAREIVVRLIIDSGVSNRGHRKNIFSSNFGVVGIASGYHASFGSMCVMDFAGGFIERGERTASL